VIHADGACLSGTADGEFHDHNGQTQKQQAQYIDQHKAAAAVLAGQPGELPDVAAADGTACAQQDKAQTGGQSLSLIHIIHLSFLVVINDIVTDCLCIVKKIINKKEYSFKIFYSFIIFYARIPSIHG
jgi:hypothetical protein